MVSLEKTPSQPTRPSADVKHGQVLEASANDSNDLYNLSALGYKPELRRNRSMFTLLFQSLAIAAVSNRVPLDLALALQHLILAPDSLRVWWAPHQCDLWWR